MPDQPGEPIIRVRGLVNRFGAETVHDGLDLDVFRGEVLGVVGGSGSGKSVLLRTIIGLNRPAAGDVEVFGSSILTMSDNDQREIEKHWGVLFQDGALFSSLTVAENIEVPIEEYYDMPMRLMDEIAAFKVGIVGLPEGTGEKFPSQLSGGMRKRAGLARALALDPEIVFLDEPTAGLDPIAAGDFDKLIGDLRSSLGLTVFMVTHDLDSLFAICDRVAVLVDKKIRVGTLDQMVQDDHPWIRSYFHGPRGRAAQHAESGHRPQTRPRLALRLRPEPFRTPEADRWRREHITSRSERSYCVIIFLAFGGVLWLSRTEFSQVFAPYYIFFKGSVAGLSKGSAVQYNGIPVGRVTDIRVDPDNIAQIQVTVEIDTNLVTIKSDARAFLDTNILSGVSTVQIRGGTQAARDLEAKPGHRYPVIEPERSELEEVKASLPELTGELKAAAAKLNALLNEQNRQAVADSLQNVRTLTAALADHSQDFGAILDNANAAMVELKTLLQHVDQSYAGHGGLKDQISQTLKDYDKLAANLTDTSRQLQLMLGEARPGIRNFSQQTLPAVDDLVSDAQQLAANLTRLVEQLERDPTRLLFGDRREGYRPR